MRATPRLGPLLVGTFAFALAFAVAANLLLARRHQRQLDLLGPPDPHGPSDTPEP